MSTEYQTVLTGSYDEFFRDGGFYIAARADIGYANLGLFHPDTPDFAAACENLMQRLLGLLRGRDGPALDVGCGLGGSTEFLARHFPAGSVYGINVSDYQIEQCRRRVPGCHFETMPAERMRFPDAMFNSVVSVEAALHFKGRREFLLEALRVLKPGGELVVADMLFHAEPQAFRKILSGQEIYADLDTYRELWQRCGFQDISLDDITTPAWRGFTTHLKNHAFQDLLAHRIDVSTFQRLIHFGKNIENLPVSNYVIAYGRKAR